MIFYGLVFWILDNSLCTRIAQASLMHGNQAGKARGKPAARTSKRKRDADDDNDDEGGGNEPASEEEVISQKKKAKSKRESKPKGPGKNPQAKKKKIQSK